MTSGVCAGRLCTSVRLAEEAWVGWVRQWQRAGLGGADPAQFGVFGVP
jgi:hypothetical protein